MPENKPWKQNIRNHYSWLQLRFMPNGEVLGFDKDNPDAGWIVVLTTAQLKQWIADYYKGKK